MALAFLTLAGMFEIGWPLGIKLSQQPEYRIACLARAMGMSGWLLWLAQRDIPIGTAYAVWTGIGGAGTFVVGVMSFRDAQTFGRWVGVAMIIGGVIALKLAQ